MNNKLIEAALTVAKKYPVFPTDNKRPCWSNKELGVGRGEGGYKIATQEPDEVRRLFSHPRATEIAVPMGEMSGLICIDVDTYKMKAGELDGFIDGLPPTLVHSTRSGGAHYIYRHPGNGYRFPATLRPGVDVKAGGTGYICWPGTEGYGIAFQKAVADCPMDVIERAMREKGGTGSLTTGSGTFNEASDEALIELIRTAEDFHASLRTLSWRMAGRGIAAEVIVGDLMHIMRQSAARFDSHPRYVDWLERYDKIEDMVDSALDKNRVPELTPEEIEALTDGEAFVTVNPTEPQRETTQETILERAAGSQDGASSQFEAISAQSLTAETIPPIQWVIPQVIPTEGIVSLGGSSSVGKTRWLAGLVTALAVGGTDRIGLPEAEAASSMWIANEERREDIKRRVKAVTIQHGDRTSRDIFIRGKDEGAIRLVKMDDHGNPVIDEEVVVMIVQEARRATVALIIFDPYVTLSDGVDENSAAVAALLTKVFGIIASLTGAAVLHAHHTPKDRSKDNDWYRGDAGAWRGSGAIHSGLDVGLTLAPWMPRNAPQRKAWKAQSLSQRLSRWIVLDTGKQREGEDIVPVLYELVGQEMGEDEGAPIGVCRLATEAEAEECLLAGAVDGIQATALAELLLGILGYGTHPSPHQELKGHVLWPCSAQRMQAQHHAALLDTYSAPYRFPGGTIRYVDTGKRAAAKYAWIIEERTD